MDDVFAVHWKDTADNDLRRITRYIADQGAPIAADKLEQKIRKEAASLSYSPYRVFYNKKRGTRKCNVGNYLIFFKIYEDTTPKTVIIQQIIHGRRNLRRWVR